MDAARQFSPLDALETIRGKRPFEPIRLRA